MSMSVPEQAMLNNRDGAPECVSQEKLKIFISSTIKSSLALQTV